MAAEELGLEQPARQPLQTYPSRLCSGLKIDGVDCRVRATCRRWISNSVKTSNGPQIHRSCSTPEKWEVPKIAGAPIAPLPMWKSIDYQTVGPTNSKASPTREAAAANGPFPERPLSSQHGVQRQRFHYHNPPQAWDGRCHTRVTCNTGNLKSHQGTGIVQFTYIYIYNVFADPQAQHLHASPLSLNTSPCHAQGSPSPSWTPSEGDGCWCMLSDVFAHLPEKCWTIYEKYMNIYQNLWTYYRHSWWICLFFRFNFESPSCCIFRTNVSGVNLEVFRGVQDYRATWDRIFWFEAKQNDCDLRGFMYGL